MWLSIVRRVGPELLEVFRRLVKFLDSHNSIEQHTVRIVIRRSVEIHDADIFRDHLLKSRRLIRLAGRFSLVVEIYTRRRDDRTMNPSLAPTKGKSPVLPKRIHVIGGDAYQDRQIFFNLSIIRLMHGVQDVFSDQLMTVRIYVRRDRQK